jgi:hypothetical protein
MTRRPSDPEHSEGVAVTFEQAQQRAGFLFKKFCEMSEGEPMSAVLVALRQQLIAVMSKMTREQRRSLAITLAADLLNEARGDIGEDIHNAH